MCFDKEKARAEFESILQDQKYSADPKPFTVGLLGWCNYRLGRYDEAIRLLETSLSRSSDKQLVEKGSNKFILDLNESQQFDLALAFLASGRTKLAEDAYKKGYDLTKIREAPRQRGLYYIAMFDLAEARRNIGLGREADSIFETVKQWLADSGVQLRNLTWLAEAETKA